MHDSQPLPPYPAKPLPTRASVPSLQPHDPHPLPMLREAQGWPERVANAILWRATQPDDDGGKGPVTKRNDG